MSFNIFPTENFAELRQNGGYYVDKTRFLEQFLKAWPEAALFTRPRRFGKSLFMSMLAEFFDIRKQDTELNLFEGLAVFANEKLCQEWMHQYPVISISLKDVETSTFTDALRSIQRLVSDICIKNIELLNSSYVDSEDRKELKLLHGKKADKGTLGDALFILTRAMSSHYDKPAIILIDEYDVPVANASENRYYAKMIDFMRHFLSRALKSNDYLKFAIITGALRITKESIFTGLNNLKCYDISSPDYEDIFGFTQEEVDKMLAIAGFEDRRDIIREWYDGYHFGERTDMYCPWSITQYMYDLKTRSREPQLYWKNTSQNALLRDFGQHLPAEADVQGKIAALLAGNPIAAKLNPCMNYIDIFTRADNFWTLLYLTGYLTLAKEPERFQVDASDVSLGEGDSCSLLVIPNREVREVFQTEVEGMVENFLSDIQRTALYKALWGQNVREVEKLLTRVLAGCSFHDAKESYYHGMMYGILRTDYKCTISNRETCDGRCDIIVPDKLNSRALVLEFKRASAKDKLQAGVREALGQIADRSYGKDLPDEEYTSVLGVGIAFFGKSVKVGFEVVRGKGLSPAS